jgi:HEAT repeat protein
VLKKFIFLLSIITLISCSEQVSDLYEIQKLEFSRTTVPGIFDKYIADENPLIRKQAAISMGRIQDTLYLPELKKLTGDTDPDVVESAIFSIGQIGNTESRNFLLNLFEKSAYDNHKINLLRSIGRIKGNETVDALLDLLPELEDSLCAEAIK